MLSKTTKLGCYSWSLQAVDTCPGARDSSGVFVQACEACYARSGNYRFPAVKRVRDHNRSDWKRDDWVDRMADAIGDDKYFRFFDSGDLYSVELAKKIKRLVSRKAKTKFWIPTRQWKFEKFSVILDELRQLPNTVVRDSADNFDQVLPTPNNSTILTKDVSGVYVCPAYKQDGKCLTCRACWDKSIQTIGYPGHGRSFKRIMLKEVKL
jgi:hypothetical protein